MNKKGQVTIFIIVALIIIVLVILIFVLRGKFSIPGISEREVQPRYFLESCLEDKVQEGIKIISVQGGDVNPSLYKKFKFEGEGFYNISYLCYNQNYYSRCVNQEPLLIKHLEDEIKSNIEQDVRSCFDGLTSSLDKQGYTVEVTGYRNFDLTLMPKKAKININAEIVLTKSGKRETQTNFEAYFPTELYGLANVAQEIVTREAKDCDFNYIGYMLFYPEFKITKIQAIDSSVIYKILHRDSKEGFNLAIRGCVIPPGY